MSAAAGGEATTTTTMTSTTTKRDLSPRRPWDVLGSQPMPDAAQPLVSPASSRNGTLNRNNAVSPRPTFVSKGVDDVAAAEQAKKASPRGRRRHRHTDRNSNGGDAPSSPRHARSPTRALSPTRTASTALPSISASSLVASGNKVLTSDPSLRASAVRERALNASGSIDEKRAAHRRRHRSHRHKSQRSASVKPEASPKMAPPPAAAAASAPALPAAIGVVKASAHTGDQSVPDSLRVAALKEPGASSRKSSDPMELLVGSPSRLSDDSRLTLQERLESEKLKLEREIHEMRSKLAMVATADDAEEEHSDGGATVAATAKTQDKETKKVSEEEDDESGSYSTTSGSSSSASGSSTTTSSSSSSSSADSK
jgi:hypothetical protein